MSKELRASYNERRSLLESLAQNLEKELKDILIDTRHVDRVSFRVKGVDSFLNKALDPENKPPYTHPLVEIEDQVAGRIIVFFLSDIPKVVAAIDRNFNTVEASRRKPERDAEFGYESHHLICVIPPHLKPAGWEEQDDLPRTFELQVRTIFMHAYAEPQHDIGYKEAAELPQEIRRELAWIAASSWGADQAYERTAAWHERNAREPQPSDESSLN